MVAVQESVDREYLKCILGKLVDFTTRFDDFDHPVNQLIQANRGARLRGRDLRLALKCAYLQVLIDEVIDGLCFELAIDRGAFEREFFTGTPSAIEEEADYE